MTTGEPGSADALTIKVAAALLVEPTEFDTRTVYFPELVTERSVNVSEELVAPAMGVEPTLHW